MKFNLKTLLRFNGKEIELTEAQLKQLGIIPKKEVSLQKDGKLAKIGDYEFIVLKNTTCGVHLLMKDCLCDSKFGNNNDFRNSKVKAILDDFAGKIIDIIGKENLLSHRVDLTADDGLTCYGSVIAEMSLLTANMAREYVGILDEFKLDKFWWLATPYSTPKHEDSMWVKCVSPHGRICRSYGGDDVNVVRPFCIVNPSIFVS